jgi:hypothetical protein
MFFLMNGLWRSQKKNGQQAVAMLHEAECDFLKAKKSKSSKKGGGYKRPFVLAAAKVSEGAVRCFRSRRLEKAARAALAADLEHPLEHGTSWSMSCTPGSILSIS